MKSPILHLAVFFATLLAFAACSSESAPLFDATTVSLRVDFDDAWSLDQLEVVMGEKRARSPETPTRLSSGERVQVLVSDDAAGKPLELGVWGYAAGERVAHGQTEVTPRKQQTTDALVTLAHLPCGAWCTAGTTSCAGDGVRMCGQRDADPCMEWSEPVACPSEAPFCSLGQCRADCIDECAEGDSRCAGPGAIERCGQVDSDSCLDWLPEEACGDGLSCQSGVCSAGACEDDCEPGERRCEGQGVLSCGQFDADDCLDWSTLSACPAGEFCSDGQCGDTCEDDCSENTCDGLNWRQCGQYDLDPCSDLSPGSSCQPADGCQEGSCSAALGCAKTPKVCNDAPDNTCVNSATMRVYQAQGSCGAGKCDYPSEEIACPNCPSCDPCAQIVCNKPPEPSQCYAPQGTCNAAGKCDYDYANGDSCNDGDSCTDGDSCNNGSCQGTQRACAVAPDPVCVNATTLRTYGAPGTCAAGGCSFPESEVSCAEGCANGACNAGCADEIVVVDSVGKVGRGSSLALDGAGSVHLSYQDYTNKQLKYAYQPVGGAWSTTVVDSAGDVGRESSLSVDGAGGVHVGYYDATEGNLKYGYKPPDGMWSTVVVDSVVDVGSHTSLYFDSGGGVHIAYMDRLNVDLKYAYKSPGGVWSRAVVDTAGWVGADTSLAVDSDGGVHVSYHDDTHSDLKYAYKPFGGVWSTTVVESESTVGQFTSLALDSAGGVHVSYSARAASALKYAHKPFGGAWSTTVVDSAGNVGSYTSLSLDSIGGVHVSYRDRDAEGLKYAHKSSGQAWVTTFVDAQDNVGIENALSVDSSGGVHISYYDWTNGDLKYARICP